MIVERFSGISPTYRAIAMATPESAAAERRRRILAKSEDRLKLVRGASAPIAQYPSSASELSKDEPSVIAAAKKLSSVEQERSSERILDTALAELEILPSFALEPTQSTQRAAASVDDVADLPAVERPAAERVQSAPRPPTATSVAALSMAQRARSARITYWIYWVCDALLVVIPVILGLILAYIALGCGWVSGGGNAGAVGTWLSWLGLLVGPKVDGAELVRLEALARLSGVSLPRPIDSLDIYAVVLPAWLPFPEAVEGKCSSLLDTAQHSSVPYLMLFVTAWRLALEACADACAAFAGGSARAKGGWVQGGLSLLASLAGGRLGGAGSTMLRVLPWILKVSSTVQTSIRDSTVVVAVALVSLTIAASTITISGRDVNTSLGNFGESSDL